MSQEPHKLVMSGPEQVDLNDFVALLRAAFADLMSEHQVPDFWSVEHFQWKYSAPLGPPRMVTIYEGEKLVSTISMNPVRLQRLGKTVLAWQAVEAGTLPSARGKKYFFQGLNALQETLKDDEVLFAFPNKNSYTTFAKLGWVEQKIITTWVRVFPCFKKDWPEISSVQEFGAEHDSVFEKIVAVKHPCLEKNAAYLNWRYLRNPKKIYSAFEIREGRGVRGLVVLRTAEVSGRKVGLIMDLLATDAAAKRTLLRFAAAWAGKQSAWPVLTFQTPFSFFGALSCGYLPVPSKLLPKRNVLMGWAKGAAKTEFAGQDWFTQTGDWDGF